MKVAVRADAYAALGTGHVMRCIALAQGILESGNEVVFITYCDSEGLITRLNNEGFDLHFVSSPGSLMESLSLFERIRPDWVALDGYHFDADFQKAVKDAGHKLLVIDDYERLTYYNADIILNQNYGAECFHYNTGQDTKVLLGVRYAILRKEFLKYRGFERSIHDVVEKLLITMGGADPDNNTLKVLKAVNLIKTPLSVRAVVGAANPHYETLTKEVEGSRHDVEILKGVADMAPIMAWADAAVSAGGSTIWELAFMGVPTLLSIVADNQKLAVNALVKDGVFQSAGWVRDVTHERMAVCMSRLLCDNAARRDMQKKMQKIVDGHGVDRISSALRNSNVRLRLASMDDAENIFEWRNHPEIRKYCFDSSPLQWEKHLEWFRASIALFDRIFLIAEIEGQTVGVLRYDLHKDEALVSLYLRYEATGKGIGPLVLQLGNKWLREYNPGIRRTIAEVKADNAGSVRAFQKAGYRESNTVYVYNLYN